LAGLPLAGLDDLATAGLALDFLATGGFAGLDLFGIKFSIVRFMVIVFYDNRLSL
jgi:hypothetical protein